MLIPRLGAIVLLVGLGFAAAQVLQLMFIVGVEGHMSWAPLLGFVAPATVVATASAVLVLSRRQLGFKLVPAVVVVVLLTAILTFFAVPPVGQFLDDYKTAALARGVEVPKFYADQGFDEARYVEHRVTDIRTQGTLGALTAVGIYAVLVRVRFRRRPASAESARTA